MTEKQYRIYLRKEALKFSSAHMTVFPDGTKEPLHGHNYSTEITIEIQSQSASDLISFSYFKDRISQICREWDEKVLIPEKSPFLKIKNRTSTEVEFFLCHKRYVLPGEEVLFLPLDNITSESLAEEICRLLIQKIDANLLGTRIQEVVVRIDESLGQGASFTWRAT